MSEKKQSLREYLDEKLKSNSLRAPDRNPLVASQADLAKKVKALLNQYETKKLGKIDSPWNKYGAGHSIGDLLFGQSPELLDDISYGMNPFTSGGKYGRLPIPDKRLLDVPVPTPATGGLGVVKKEGGNWLSGSVERALNGLKREDAITRLDPNVMAINSWIDNTLTKYVKNRMATPSDEVRKLADQDILHYEPYRLSADLERDIKKQRKLAGFPIEGMADHHITGTGWEDASDSVILNEKAGELANSYLFDPITSEKSGHAIDNPWLSKLEPDTPVHDIGYTYDPFLDVTGFDHLIDELLNATNPDSGLPMNLRMKPEGFKGLTMEEAVKKVHGINQFRAKQAEAARKKMSRAEGIPTTKTYDDGFRWVAPEDVTKNPKHREYVVDVGKRGAWCTQGDVCDYYAGGDSRVQILLDDFGNPHAQIAIETEKKIKSPYLYLRNNRPDLEEQVNERFENYYNSLKSEKPSTTLSVDYRNKLKDEFAAELPEWQNYLQEPPKQKITEIKPLGNSWNDKKVRELMVKDPDYQRKIQEKLQDFVKSGNWSDVGDLQNTGLYRFGDSYLSIEEIRADPDFNAWLMNKYAPEKLEIDYTNNRYNLLRAYSDYIDESRGLGGWEPE